MNKDLIDRDALFEKVTNMYRYAKGEERIAYRNVLDVILNVESESVEEITQDDTSNTLTAMWKQDGYIWYCTNCKGSPHITYSQVGCQTIEEYDFSDYCSHCGAKMLEVRGESNEH